MIWLAAGAATLVLFLLASRAFTQMSPATLARVTRNGAAAALVIGGLFLTIRGAIWLGPLLIATAGPLVAPRLVAAVRRFFSGSAAPGAARISEVETAWIRMRLDRTSGEMSGTVLQGAFAGLNLADLSLAQLVSLMKDLRVHDADGARLIETYVDRVHGDAWRSTEEPPHARPPSSTDMTREDALAVLGLREGATREDILAAHRRLMMQMHPDKGGSDYLAAKINAAKAVLVGE